MSIRYQCPACQSVRNIHERLRGHEIRCPDCEARFRLPTLEEEAAERQKAIEENPFIEIELEDVVQHGHRPSAPIIPSDPLPPVHSSRESSPRTTWT